uniref:G-patch domain-containing protein n=1 Tax=Nicotiana tabacum TaxID=4097 RepID=A0A1S4AYV5_TOBAC
MSYSTIKATTQAIQSGTGSLLGKKKKDDVAMFVSGSGRGPRGSPHQYTQPRPQPQAYTQAPYNPYPHYFPPQDPQYSVRPPQYHVHHAQSYAQPPPYPQWRAPTPQNPYLPPQPYRNPTGPSFQSTLDYRKERQQRKETFTPLGESYTSLFQRLRQLDVLRPIEPKTPNPPPRNLDYSLRCAYCSDAPGRDIVKCWHLKRNPEAPNINQNPLPAHAETHMIEIVHKDGEPKNSSKSVMMIRASESNPVKAPDSAKAMPLTVEGVSEKLSTLNVKPSVLVVKGPPIDIEANQEKQKVIVPRVPGKPVIIVEGACITPVIIKPVTQLPMVDTKAVPWNYNQVIVTYKGKEVEEEVNETGGLTRSGRCFTPEELRKSNPFKDGHIPVKKQVTEEDAEEVLADNGSSANICPLSTLQKLKIGTERIHMNNVCVRGFDGGGKDSVGDIMLELSIWPVEFTMEFEVLDVVVSYNLLLGRPWIHAAKAIPSSLYQMVKFEWDRQEIAVHGDEKLSAYNDTIVPFIEIEDDKGPWVYQTFETMSVEKIPEGECIPGPKLPSVSVMVENEMLKNGFMPGKGLGSSLQGIAHPVCPRESFGTFGLGFTLTRKDMKKAKNLKRKAWSLPKHVPHISKSFVKPGVAKRPISVVPKPVVNFDEELIKRFRSLFDEVNMVEIREGSSNADVQLVGPN